MSGSSLKMLCLAGLVGASVFASAQNKNQWKFDYIGLEAGAYFPSSGLIRDRFGSTIFRVGVTPMMIRRTADWRPSFELGYMGARGHGDHFAVFPLTVGVQKTFGNPDESTVPFVRAGIGGAYFDYDITKPSGATVRGHKLGGAGSLEAGFISGDRFRASIRAYMFSKQSGIDFGGILVSATFGVFKL